MLACMRNDLLETSLYGRRVFLFLYMEGSFTLLQTDDLATVVDIRSHNDNATLDGNCLQHVGNVAIKF